MKNHPVVFDVDGTLTLEYYNEGNLLTLQENPAMVSIALLLQTVRPLLISTARPERLRDVTEQWLAKHGITPKQVYMRPNDEEGVRDHLIKLEHLYQIRDMHGQPHFWVDDNPYVVLMLRDNDVPVIQVKP